MFVVRSVLYLGVVTRIRVSERVDDRRGDPPRYVVVSDADAELVSAYTWSMGRGPNAYAVASPRRGVQIYMHRLIAGAQPGQEVDHIDRDTTNNTRGNLRIVTHAENMRNRRPNALRSRARRGTPTL